MIDPSIITRGAELAQLQQQQNMEALGNLGGNLGKMVLGRRINQMRQLDSDNERKAFANNSVFAPYLNETLRGDQAAAQKAQQASEDRDYEILKRKIDHSKAASSAIASILNGNPNPSVANFALQHLKTGGLLNDDMYIQTQKFLTDNANDPEAIKVLANSLATIGAEKPEQFLMPDANNVNTNATSIKNNELDNKTSRENNQDSVRATLNGQQLDYKLGEAKLKQDNDQFKKNFEYTAQQDEIKNGQVEVKEFNGKAYIVYKNGDYRPMVGEDGQQLSASGSKGMTEQQSKDALFGSRMQQANNILDALEKEGVSAPFLNHTGKLGEAAAQVLPSFLGGASSKQQQYVQAQRDFINAVLRKESGAVIGEEEFENAKKQYFPQPGDSDAVIKQKAQNRKLALNMIVQSSGSTGQEAIKAGVVASSTPTFSRAAVAQAAKQRGVTVEQVQREIEARGGQVR